jgi:hypothetical protein
MPLDSVEAAQEWRMVHLRPRVHPYAGQLYRNGRYPCLPTDGKSKVESDGDDGVGDDGDADELLINHGLVYLWRITKACEQKDFARARAELDIFRPMLRMLLWFERYEHLLESDGLLSMEDERAWLAQIRAELLPDMRAVVCLHEKASYRAVVQELLSKIEGALPEMEARFAQREGEGAAVGLVSGTPERQD